MRVPQLFNQYTKIVSQRSDSVVGQISDELGVALCSIDQWTRFAKDEHVQQQCYQANHYLPC